MLLIYNERWLESIEDVVEELITEDDIDSDGFDDMLLDDYGWITIEGIDFHPAKILEELDPIAYRCLVTDWKDDKLYTRRLESECELDLMLNEDGDEWDCNGCIVKLVMDFEDDEDEQEDDEDED